MHLLFCYAPLSNRCKSLFLLWTRLRHQLIKVMEKGCRIHLGSNLTSVLTHFIFLPPPSKKSKSQIIMTKYCKVNCIILWLDALR